MTIEYQNLAQVPSLSLSLSYTDKFWGNFIFQTN